MLSKPKIAYIRSLHDKSTRLSEGIFLVEWRKCMGEFLDSDFEIVEWFFTEKFVSESEQFFSSLDSKEFWQSPSLRGTKQSWLEGKQWKWPIHASGKIPHTIISENELGRITTLSSNDSGLLLVKMRANISPKINREELVLVLDRINDPGNFGTIIRIADWYGIKHIVASPDTVDCYNPKVLMATMGSFTRVAVYYTDLEKYLSKSKGNIYGAYLDGESTHTKKFISEWAYLVIGSEAHGISPDLEKYITDKVTIPRFGLAESLNAGVATAVILDRMRSV